MFSNVLLVDEINRASPKTQSALLEAMQENQVTVDGETYPLERPFLVIATQNPVEFEGTYPLPEAQLDRFAVRFALGYPAAAEEARMLTEQTSEPPLDRLVPVVERTALVAAIAAAKDTFVEESINRYIVSLLQHTRDNADSCSVRAREPGSRSCGSRRLGQRPNGETSSFPTTFRRSQRPCWGIGCSWPRRRPARA